MCSTHKHTHTNRVHFHSAKSLCFNDNVLIFCFCFFSFFFHVLKMCIKAFLSFASTVVSHSLIKSALSWVLAAPATTTTTTAVITMNKQKWNKKTHQNREKWRKYDDGESMNFLFCFSSVSCERIFLLCVYLLLLLVCGFFCCLSFDEWVSVVFGSNLDLILGQCVPLCTWSSLPQRSQQSTHAQKHFSYEQTFRTEETWSVLLNSVCFCVFWLFFFLSPPRWCVLCVHESTSLVQVNCNCYIPNWPPNPQQSPHSQRSLSLPSTKCRERKKRTHNNKNGTERKLNLNKV